MKLSAYGLNAFGQVCQLLLSYTRIKTVQTMRAAGLRPCELQSVSTKNMLPALHASVRWSIQLMYFFIPGASL